MNNIPFFTELKDLVHTGGYDAYFVGGSVRDVIMGRDIHDIDMVCFSHDYKDFAQAVKKALPSVWVEFKDNIRLVRGRVEIDISKPRGLSMEEDLRRRDFTINNLAMSFGGEIFGDMTDLNAGVIRHISENTFSDDPIRILRVFRFVSQLGFTMTDSTREKIINEKLLLKNTACERIFGELDKLFSGKHSVKALREMINTGVYSVLIEGVPPGAVDEMTAARGRGFEFFISGIFTRADAQTLRQVSASLNLPNSMKKRASAISYVSQKLSEMLESDNDFSIRKLIYAYPYELEDGLELFRIISENKGENPVYIEKSADRVMNQLKYVDFTGPDRINGELLSELGVVKGPQMGQIIKEIRPMMASGELPDIDSAVKYIKQILKV